MVWPAIIAAGASLLGSIISSQGNKGGGNPGEVLQRAHRMGKETFDPYIQGGHLAQQKATDRYNRMVDNPMDYSNEIIAGYTPSAGYQFREKKALEAARNAAAAGGISGTHNDQGAQAELVNGLLGQDMQQWLQNVLGIQTTGLQGLENQASRGLGASQSLAELLGNVAGSEASLAYNNQQAGRNDLGNIIGGIGGLAGSLGGLFGKGDGGGGNRGGINAGARNITRAGGMGGNWAGNIGGNMAGGALGNFRPSVYGGGRG